MTHTSTVVKWADIPLMLENGFEIDLFSDTNQEAIMSKFGMVELDDKTKLPVGLESKRGKPQISKPKPDISQPPMHRK